MSERPALIDLDEDHRELREPVRALCARYPGEYWREKDRGLNSYRAATKNPERITTTDSSNSP